MKLEPSRLALRILSVGLFAFAAYSAEANDFAHAERLANEGDAAAMTELGLRYHQGDGVKQNYQKAYDWYLKAVEKGDGDALNNIGVMYRDGLGIPKNEKIAYLLFLAVHMESLGDESTQMRANRNLRRAMEELPKSQLHEALSYTWPYVVQVLKSRGKELKPSPDVLPTKDRPRIRDNDWWTDRERAAMKFESPTPWEKPGT